MLQEIIDETSFNNKINENQMVLVDFFATWCQPCKVLKAMLSEISPDYPDVSIVTVDIELIPSLAERFRIGAVPTVIMFENGEMKDRLVGLPNKQDLKQFFEGKGS